ncbi:hypothetical protein AK812_SmicGene13500 [Symbiodinium microadriaticum]|uniref:Uncharacterized protein n=1 Tax=Symbiodinium microadriaticum TaxID=2951 RepID=A0A1Q9E802_SYMMI|nr:hypothetical protein AK812_SmicGene13500 [Symbiodinium microadriaticum]
MAAAHGQCVTRTCLAVLERKICGSATLYPDSQVYLDPEQAYRLWKRTKEKGAYLRRLLLDQLGSLWLVPGILAALLRSDGHCLCTGMIREQGTLVLSITGTASNSWIVRTLQPHHQPEEFIVRAFRRLRHVARRGLDINVALEEAKEEIGGSALKIRRESRAPGAHEASASGKEVWKTQQKEVATTSGLISCFVEPQMLPGENLAEAKTVGDKGRLKQKSQLALVIRRGQLLSDMVTRQRPKEEVPSDVMESGKKEATDAVTYSNLSMACALKPFSLHFFNPSFGLTNLDGRLLTLPVDTVTILTLGHLARRKYS